MPTPMPAEARDKLERHKEAIRQQSRFQNLKNTKDNQTWLHDRAINLADEFESVADDGDWDAFWTRENVVKTIDKGDMPTMCHWLRVAINKSIRGW